VVKFDLSMRLPGGHVFDAEGIKYVYPVEKVPVA